MEPVRVPSIPEKTELVRTDAYFDDEALYLNLGLIRSPSKRVSVWRVFQAKSSRSESAVYVGDARFSERPCCPQFVSSSAPQERLRKSSFVYKTMSFTDGELLFPRPTSKEKQLSGSLHY